MAKNKCGWLLIAFFIVLSGSQAQHMNEQDSPCAKAVVTVDLAACLEKARASSDAELNTVYGHIRKRLDETEARQLVGAQRFWIQYRDANCEAERDLYGNGTGRGPAYLACLESMTRLRTKELRVTYRIRLK